MKRTAKLALLAALLLACVAAALWQRALERRWHATPPRELYAVVWQQLAAFREADYPAAYGHASMSFQEKFPVTVFADLVRAEYPGLMRAQRLEFGAVRFAGRRATIPAYFFLPEGDILPCLYLLIREEDAWKIEGARVLQRWPATRRLGGTRT